MKRRVIVMNGQKIVEAEIAGKWVVEKVSKAKGIKPGIYNLYQAIDADKAQALTGFTVHIDDNNVYQKTNRGLVKYDRSVFDSF
ncbi:KfrB domain-containing protein [Methylobacter sp. YRD-M1]|uniref:KfrB domain-containing protein n=1 Tax=Methylobacter sp. YRD-M1 TaxID=2911520 RepID=UPI00227AA89F|nr:KfrB domain-containing protein [Methylobacter sp. YRD-M1]WAK04358.1 conjugal transfer protein TraO [Methylobacter sp. YRD-M1]